MSDAPTPAELRAFADEHLSYEIAMLFLSVRSAGVPVIVPVSDTALAGFFGNARVEVFVIHLRALIGFLFPDKYTAFSGDITAEHYVNDVSGWLARRGGLSKALDAAKVRADKEVAHVTDRRKAGVPREKAWAITPLANEIRELLLRFVATADPERLGLIVAGCVPREPLT